MKSKVPKIAVVVILTAVLLYFFGRTVNWKDVPAQIADISLPLFLLAVPLFLLHFVTRAIRWHVLASAGWRRWARPSAARASSSISST